MREGVYLLAHQAGPGLHDLPLVPGDPESGEEGEGSNEDLWSVFYCLCDTNEVTHDENISLPVRGGDLKSPCLWLQSSLNCAITSV